MTIHPSAIVDPGAKLGRDVAIGPYSVVGAQAQIGDRTILQTQVVVEGEVVIGERNVIGHGCVIGGPPQDLGFKPETRSRVEIGNGNILREYCTVHRGSPEGTATTIGDENFFMVGVHVGHNCHIANRVIIANNCLLAGYVEVQDQAFLGGGSTFHQHMRVGRLVMVQGSSAFGKDLPPFTLAAERNAIFGLNSIGLRRAGFSAQERAEIKDAFKLLYLSGLNLSQVRARAAQTEWHGPAREFFAFVAAAKKRSVCPLRRGGAADETA